MSVFQRIFGSGSQTNTTTARSSAGRVSYRTFEASDTIPVTIETAMSVPAVSASMDVIAGSIAMLPLRTYRMQDGVATQVEDAESNVINNIWDSHWTRSSGIQFMIEQTLKFGFSTVHVYRNREGRIEKLTPMPSDYITIARKNGVQSYEYDNPLIDTGTPPVLMSDDVIDVVYKYADNGFDRISPILTEASEVIQRYLLQSRAARRVFSSGSPPMAVMFPPWDKNTSKEQQQAVRDGIFNQAKAANRKGSPFMFFEHGTAIQNLGIDMEKNQFVEQQLAMTQEVARVFNIPPPIIGDLSKGTYNNTEQSASFLLRHTLQPWNTKFEQEFSRKLFPDGSKFVKFDTSGFVRPDRKTSAEVAARLVVAGIASQNEARTMNNLERKSGDEYDELHQQQQMVDPVIGNERPEQEDREDGRPE